MISKLFTKMETTDKRCFCGETEKLKNVKHEDFQDVFCDKHYEEWKIESDASVVNDLIFIIAGISGLVLIFFSLYLWLN